MRSSLRAIQNNADDFPRLRLNGGVPWGRQSRKNPGLPGTNGPGTEVCLSKCSNLARGESMKDPVSVLGRWRGFHFGMLGLRPQSCCLFAQPKAPALRLLSLRFPNPKPIFSHLSREKKMRYLHTMLRVRKLDAALKFYGCFGSEGSPPHRQRQGEIHVGVSVRRRG